MKSQLGAGIRLPTKGSAFISVKAADKPAAVEIAKMLADLGFKLLATRGTAAAISAAGIPVASVNKVTEGRPHVVDMIKNGDVQFVINTVEEKRSAIADSRSIRTTALASRVTTYTTIAGARAAVEGIRHLSDASMSVIDVQSMHKKIKALS